MHSSSNVWTNVSSSDVIRCWLMRWNIFRSMVALQMHRRNREVWHGTSHEYSWKLQRTTCLPGCLAIFTELAWRKKSKSSDFREIERNKAIDRGVHFRSRNIGVFTHIRASTSSEPAVVDLQSADCSRYSFEQINTHDRFTEECLTFWLILSDSDISHILGLLLRTGKW